MDKGDLCFLSATELSRLIQRKEVSPVEATEAYLDRIDSLDFQFNSYLTVCRKEALQDARKAEKAIVRGNYLGPMHGIPFAVKDQLWSKGVRTTGGSRILADFVPDEDATPIANLKKAGAILLGKTNLFEFAIYPAHRFSEPRNPWNLDMTPGGSSGGSGCATAAFLCATSLGEDTGGSLRLPASWCGLVGMIPSWGRVSRYGLMSGVWSLDVVGPISRTVEDAAITLQTIAGYDPKDPYTWNTPVPDYTQSLDGDLRGMRIGVIGEQINSKAVEPEVRKAVVEATSVLRSLGASVEEVSVPLTVHHRAIVGMHLIVETAVNHRARLRERPKNYARGTRVYLLTGSLFPAQVYYKAQKLRSLLRQQLLDALKTHDVLVLPTLGIPAPRIQEAQPFTSKGSARLYNFLLTPMFNLAGAPAMSVPCGFSSEGLPFGLQIGGRPGDEKTVIKVGHAYQQATSWHTMRPPTA